MAIEKELLDRLLAGRDPNEVFAKDGLLDDLKKAPGLLLRNGLLSTGYRIARRGRPRCRSRQLQGSAVAARQRSLRVE
jgi:hypothetical protein